MDKPATAAEVVPQQQSDVDTRERALEVDTSASLPAAGLARVGNSPAAIAIAPAAIADAAASDARLMESLHQDDRTPERQSFAKMILVNMLAALTVSFAALSLGDLHTTTDNPTTGPYPNHLKPRTPSTVI